MQSAATESANGVPKQPESAYAEPRRFAPSRAGRAGRSQSRVDRRVLPDDPPGVREAPHEEAVALHLPAGGSLAAAGASDFKAWLSSAAGVGPGYVYSKLVHVPTRGYYFTPVNIGMVTTTLPAPGRKPGGVDVFVDRLAARLSEQGHNVTLFSFSSPSSGSTYTYKKLSPTWVTTAEPMRLAVVPVLLNTIDTTGLDVLHLHGDDWFFFRRRLPTLRTFHGSSLFEARASRSWRRRLAQFAVYPLELLASTLATTSWSVGPGMPSAYRLDGVLGPGVTVSTEAHMPRDSSPTILFVGTWEGRKRGHFLYEVFRREVQARIPDSQLWLVSDMAPVHHPHVTWIPAPSDSELRDLYQRSWVMCSPSTYEGFGLPYLEAMANGTPVVATPNAGARFVSDRGRAALLASDPELGPALVRVLTSSSLRQRLAAAGRERAEVFSWDAVVRRYERAYLQTIRKHRQRYRMTVSNDGRSDRASGL